MSDFALIIYALLFFAALDAASALGALRGIRDELKRMNDRNKDTK